MYDLYATGATLEEVGTRFNLSRERVRQIFQEAGLSTRSITETQELRHARIVNERTDEICAAFSKYQDINQVARRLDIPRTIVSEIVASHFPGPERHHRRPRPTTPTYATSELIAFLRQASTTTHGVLGASAYQRYAEGRHTDDGRPWPSTYTCAKRFGSWRKALTQAALPVTPRKSTLSRRKFSDQDCIEALRKAAKTLERVPTTSAYNELARASRGRLPSSMTITNRLGTWYDALTKAGL